MSLRPRSMIGTIALGLVNAGFSLGASLQQAIKTDPPHSYRSRARYYTVSQRVERGAKFPQMVRKSSKAKSSKRRRSVVRMRSHG